MDSRPIVEPSPVTDYDEAQEDLQHYRFGHYLSPVVPAPARGPPSSPGSPIGIFTRYVQRQAWDLPSRLRPRACSLGLALLRPYTQLVLLVRPGAPFLSLRCLSS